MTEPLAIDELFRLWVPWFCAWTVVSSRFFGLTLVLPIFSWINLPMSLRFGFSAAAALPITYGLWAGTGLAHMVPLGMELMLLIMKEIVVGVGVGFLAGIPFWGVQSAGDLIDSYRGSTAATLFDTSQAHEAPVLGTALMLFMLALFVWGGGMTFLLGIVFDSLRIWPPFETWPQLNAATGDLVATKINSIAVIGLEVAGVLLFIMFAVDLGLAIASRSMRQIEMSEMTLTVKNLAFAFLLPLMAVPMVSLMQRYLPQIVGLVDVLEAVTR